MRKLNATVSVCCLCAKVPSTRTEVDGAVATCQKGSIGTNEAFQSDRKLEVEASLYCT